MEKMLTDLGHLTLLLVLSLGAEACSTTYVLTTVPQQTPYFTTQYMSYGELTAKHHDDFITIVMTDGNLARGTLVRADSATIAWADITTRTLHSVPTFLVHQMEVSRNYVWEGGSIGLLVLTVPPLAMGSWGPGYPSRLDEPDYTWRYLTVIGGVLGGSVGVGVGSAIRSTDTFQVVPIPWRSKAQSGPAK